MSRGRRCGAAVSDEAVAGAASSRSTRPVMTVHRGHRVASRTVYPTGFEQSPYADVARPARSRPPAPQAVALQPGQLGGLSS